MILKDQLLLLGVCGLVFILIGVQTRSVFITVAGFLEILLSFPLAYFVYRVVCGVNYFHFLSFLGVFIMLGIGADDIFILNDAWRQSDKMIEDVGEDADDVLIKRMQW